MFFFVQFSSSGVIANVNRIYEQEILPQIHRRVRHNRQPNVRQTVVELILMFAYKIYKISYSTFDGISRLQFYFVGLNFGWIFAFHFRFGLIESFCLLLTLELGLGVFVQIRHKHSLGFVFDFPVNDSSRFDEYIGPSRPKTIF